MKNLPKLVIPILEKVRESKLTPSNLELEVWNYPNHQAWVDIFLELGIELFNSDLDASELPIGYKIVGFIFDWESQNQFDGWLALTNRANFIPEICHCYELVGLPREAQSIRNAFDVWNSEINNYEEAAEAYSQGNPEYPDELTRMENVVCYLIDNKEELFYENTA